MTKVVINTCYGGFGLSEKAEDLYEKYSGNPAWTHDLARDDPNLVRVVEELGDAANSGGSSKLAIVELPPGTHYIIDEYDGIESLLLRDEMSWLVA